MKPQLAPLHQQVMVITGASSGIGLATARMAARRGARLVVAARTEEALKQLVAELQSHGTEAIFVVADVGNEDDVRRIAEEAINRFGRIDTWVNDAGVSIYGKIETISTEDNRRLFDTNFWGVVHGSKQAVKHLGVNGGALINVGSVVSDVSLPIQGMYAASKHAVKGFTDALRMEVEQEGLPVSVTLIKPGSINTPFTRHAKNYLNESPDLPPPVYAPEVVARAIVHAAENPVRDVYVGGGGKMLATMGRFMPRMTDRYMSATMEQQQKSGHPRGYQHREALHRGNAELSETGDAEGHVMGSSAYTSAVLHPLLTAAAVVAGVGIAAGLLARSRPTPTQRVMRAPRATARRLQRLFD
jgi:short-subunit dehydrogenase